MNALQASERLELISNRASALGRFIYYVSDDPDWQDDVFYIEELKREIEDEVNELTEKLSAVNL